MKLPTGHQRNSVDLQLTPMIDVVFLLLVFFVWTSSFETEPPAGGTEASTQTPTTEPFDEIVIRLTLQDAVEVIELNGQVVDGLPQLKQRLSEVIALGVQPPVIIDPADTIRMNLAVKVYDTARAAGADRVLFAAQPE
jgi:biopolymer transport protein ExbD